MLSDCRVGTLSDCRVGTLSDCRVAAVWLPCGCVGTLSGATMEGVTRSMRRREMGDIAMCLRDLNHARASSTVGGVVWRAVTKGCYPVETIVELYIKATLGDTTAVFMYPQDSMG